MSGVKNALAHLRGKPAPDTASDSASENDAEDEKEDEAEQEEQSTDEASEDGNENEEGDNATCSRANVDAAFALMSSPEAKGRSKLAMELANDVANGSITPARARGLLKASGKSSSLSQAMSGKDKSPGQDFQGTASDLSEGDNALVATASRMKDNRAKARG
ncbi:hypothetical protein TRICHSKD4_1030 [Roseibium sp. TrichSKD4]|uniref:hypothetical protein n=1 Tax=Roseibium sp. TrichSKD4 TaxID=744980 RepID=UPI0001E5638D|nr:hypothetical protein [Roseibium sp. TrichSKD4]EFO33911.1 hypothetical protein TRICHSKD4_1030 [Roseibium sp. TrichSKD4]